MVIKPNTRRLPALPVIALCALLLAIAGPASADEFDPTAAETDVPMAGDSETGSRKVYVPGSFQPPAEALAEFDWLKLKSGEWLKGNIEYLRDGDLEFKSKELDDLVISFGDIVEIHSPHPNRYVFDTQREAIVGPATLQGDTITIIVDGQPQSHPRAELIVILEGDVRERNFWNFGAGLGMTGRSGNTDSLDLSADAFIKRETARTRWNTTYRGAFAELDGEANANNHLVRTQFDWFLTPRLYLIPLRFDFFNDEFQNIDYRLTPSTGIGYTAFKRGTIKWDVVAAPGYQYTKFGTGDNEGTFVMVLGTLFEFDITKKIDFDMQYFVNLGIPDVNETSHHAESGISFDIWGPLDFNVDFVFDRLENPRSDGDGDTPEKNDFKLVVGFGLDF